MSIRLEPIRTADELAGRVREYGFLPFFRNDIPGFSVEECTPATLWFSDTEDGPWEWKGPVARTKQCVYGKFFNRKAGFVSLEWVPDFLNLRRDGCDFDTRYETQRASWKDRQVYEKIREYRAVETGLLKSALNYRKGGNTGFDTVITRLQMQTYAVIGDFIYRRDRYMRPYGWGVAEYTTPEALFGEALCASAYDREPGESRERMLEHLERVLPGVDGRKLAKLIEG